MPRRNRLFLILLVGLISLTGCAGVGLIVGGTPEQFHKEYIGTLKTWTPQIKKISKDICKSLDGKIDTMASGPDVFSCNIGSDNSVAGNLNLMMGTGKINYTGISARFDETHKKINFHVVTTANYGVNVEKENDQKMDAFKAKLQEALNQEISLEKIE